MKDQRRAEADERNAAYAKLTLAEKYAKALNAPGKCEKQLRKLYRESMLAREISETNADRISSKASYEFLLEVAREHTGV